MRDDIAYRVVDRFLAAMEHSSPAARQDYLKDHPNADPKNHTVKKPNAKPKETEFPELEDDELEEDIVTLSKGRSPAEVAKMVKRPVEDVSYYLQRHQNRRPQSEKREERKQRKEKRRKEQEDEQKRIDEEAPKK